MIKVSLEAIVRHMAIGRKAVEAAAYAALLETNITPAKEAAIWSYQLDLFNIEWVMEVGSYDLWALDGDPGYLFLSNEPGLNQMLVADGIEQNWNAYANEVGRDFIRLYPDAQRHWDNVRQCINISYKDRWVRGFVSEDFGHKVLAGTSTDSLIERLIGGQDEKTKQVY